MLLPKNQAEPVKHLGQFWISTPPLSGSVFGQRQHISAPLGPCITTADELGDPQNVMVRSWVNGGLRQISSTSQMIWTVAELVHFFSVNVTLRPGMVIITGTPSGTAWSTDAELGGRWSGTDGMVPAKGYLQDGDRVVCEIDRIGRLENVVRESR